MSKKNNRGKAYALIAAMVVLVAVVLVVLWPKGETTPAVSQDGEIQIEMLTISTPYCDLQYPDLWPDFFRHSGSENGGAYTETFYCSMNGQELELFRIVFNGEGSEFVLGTVKADGQTVPVSVEILDVTVDESWTQGERDTVYAMAEGVNDVIQSIQASDSFKELF